MGTSTGTTLDEPNAERQTAANALFVRRLGRVLLLLPEELIAMTGAACETQDVSSPKGEEAE
jgi:hypothetical protein